MAYEPPQRDDQLPEGDPEPETLQSRTPGETPSPSSAKPTDPGDYSTLPRTYLGVLSKARVETYEAEIANAGWGKTLLGVAIVTLVSFGMKILLAPASLAAVNNTKLEMAKQGIYADVEPQKTLFQVLEDSTNPLFALVVPITFFAGSALLYLLARAVRNRDEETGKGVGFMEHSYLLSLSYTPLRTLGALLSGLSFLPIAGCLAVLVSLGLGIYQLYNAGLSMQASQNLEPGKAQAVAFVPWVVGIVLVIVVAILIAVMLGLSFAR